MSDLREKYDQLIDKLNAESEKQSSLHMLIDLYPEAANSFDHDIADSIGIFVSELGDESTISYLKNKIDNCTDNFIKNEFTEWILHLQKFRLMQKSK